MSTSRRLRGPLYALLFSFAFLACAPPRAAGQNTGSTGTIVVPQPPILGNHYAKQNENDPETAHDAWTGQDLKWDRDKKSWVDVKTGQTLGFEGQLASDGTVIPAPPMIDTPRIGLHWPRQDKRSDDNGRGNPELAYDSSTRQLLRWDRYKQSWFAADWDPNTRSQVNVGPPLGFYGVLVNANAPTPVAPTPPTAAVPATETAPPCPTPDECAVLQEIYREADARSVAAGQALIQATADRDSDLSQAAQLDKSASHRGDPDVSKAEHQQAQALRDKLPNAQANYDAAAKATLAAWENWQNCLKGMKDCPPKQPVQAGNGTATTNTPSGTTTGSTANATPGVPAQPEQPNNTNLASDLCERAKALRNIAAHDRQMADAAQDQRTKDYLLGDAKMMDGMAKERENLARYYDPEACPEHAQAIPGGNGASGQSGSGSQNSGGTTTTGNTAGTTGPATWTTGTITIPPSTTPAVAGMDPWILLVPGFPLWNKDEQRFYGSNPDGTPRKDEQPEESSSNTSSTSSATPAPAGETPGPSTTSEIPQTQTGGAPPTGGTPTAPIYQCVATTPMLRTEGISELIADIPLNCTGTPPPNSSIGLHSNVPLMNVDIGYKIGGQLFTDHFTPTNNGHRAQVNLPDELGKASDFKIGLDFAKGSWDMHDHLRFRFDSSPGISVNPGGYTAPITDNQVGSFTPPAAFVDPARYMWEHNRMPALCTDTTTTTYVPRNDFGLTVTPLDSGFGFTPPRCTLNPDRGSLTLGGGNDFGFGGLRGWSAFNTPGGFSTGTSGWGPGPGQSGGYGNNGGWGQIPQTPAGTTGFTGNGYGGYNPSPFSYIRPQAYYDDNGPQSRFLIADPWNMRPSYCNYDFPDKLLRAAPQLAQALAAEARSRQPRANRTPREAMGAHLQLVSLKRGSPTSDPSNRAGRAQLGDQRTRQVQIEARFVEVAPTFTYSIVSNGKSQGQAFELQVADPTGKVKTVAMRDGTIIEAIKPGVTEPVTAPAGGSVVKQPLNAYCLEFHKPPPAEGTLYRIADQATQEKFSSLRFLDRAAAQMSQNNQFHPDNNPEAYKNTIFQYATWSTLEGWGQEEFTQHWVERTKENAQDLHVPWTKQMEDTLRNAAPGRWGDISAMMSQAQALEKASQDRANSRQTRQQQ
jgi:hypothetical protein